MSRLLDRLPDVPSVVDEVSVRLVAAVVCLAGTAAVLTGARWLYAALAVDFLLRSAAGPRRSPVARAVQAWARPRVGAAPRPTAFAPKRFAAALGAAMTTAAVALSALGVGAGSPLAPTAVTALGMVLVLCSGLEAGLGFCVGCRVFALLARAGLVSQDVCVDCVRPASATPGFRPSDVEDGSRAHRAG